MLTQEIGHFILALKFKKLFYQSAELIGKMCYARVKLLVLLIFEYKSPLYDKIQLIF